MIGIYKITNLKNGKVYIGQSVDIERRFMEYRNRLYRCNSVVFNAFRKYGFDNFSFEILDLCEKNDLDRLEKYYIEKYDSYGNGYNMTKGGKGYSGKLSTKHKENISKSKLGEKNPNFGKKPSYETLKKRSDSFKKTYQEMDKEKRKEWRNKIGLKHKNKIVSQEQKEKISKKLKDYFSQNIVSEETRKKISKAVKGITRSEKTKDLIRERVSKEVFCFNRDKKFISKYKSAKEAAEVLGINKTNISSCCHGKRKVAGGFMWSFKSYIDL